MSIFSSKRSFKANCTCVKYIKSFRRRKIVKRSAMFSCSHPECRDTCCSSVWFNGWNASRRRTMRHNGREFKHWRFISRRCGSSSGQKWSTQHSCCAGWVVVWMMGVIRWIKVGHATWLWAGRRVQGKTKGWKRRRWMRQCGGKTRIPFLVMCGLAAQIWSVRR